MILGAQQLVIFDCNRPKIAPYYIQVIKIEKMTNSSYLVGNLPETVTVNALCLLRKWQCGNGRIRSPVEMIIFSCRYSSLC